GSTSSLRRGRRTSSAIRIVNIAAFEGAKFITMTKGDMSDADSVPTEAGDGGDSFMFAAPDAGRHEHPQQIGPYRIIELVSEGGMGSVYRAEQREPVRRIVALKLIKLGMDTREVIGRFESERQALAMMDHPHIARVIDAGATDAGRPYFVMEYVPGEPI